jgi:hypothetical protein
MENFRGQTYTKTALQNLNFSQNLYLKTPNTAYATYPKPACLIPIVFIVLFLRKKRGIQPATTTANACTRLYFQYRPGQREFCKHRFCNPELEQRYGRHRV